MKITDFNFNLPEELIAQHPLKDRSASRLMVLNREGETLEHKHFTDLFDYLQSGDLLLLNDTRVIPARLLGKKSSGGRAEIFLVRLISSTGEAERWQCMVKTSKGVKAGARIFFENPEGTLEACAMERAENNLWIFELTSKDGKVSEVRERIGKVPLPPYIKRDAGDTEVCIEDKARYQTVFAKVDGAVAAPTAALHFSEDLIKKIKSKGVLVFFLTLHTGLGTFLPLRAENISENKLHSEYYNLGVETFEAVTLAKKEGRRVVAVGTTVTRAIETVFKEKNLALAKPVLSGETDIFITPGYKFSAVSAMITNFHLPESSLIMLVSAFAGKDFILKAYAAATQERYRFFSYGDAMLIL
ncbi:MAG: tRNA preQ1(34) S-adenosylmethionine ribosyltransferase-isomerase QueA [Deltaproteobacteria bacterium]|nr:tRNA preQ1(34) S-adenosylmethionine ribosyltransferase-isomerase QueA [Deltaproteobacteria bacterium]